MNQGSIKDLVLYLSRSLVNHPEDVEITEKVNDDKQVHFSMKVNPDDMGRVIGRSGKTARAIRLLVSAKASMENKRSRVDIEDEDDRRDE